LCKAKSHGTWDIVETPVGNGLPQAGSVLRKTSLSENLWALPESESTFPTFFDCGIPNAAGNTRIFDFDRLSTVRTKLVAANRPRGAGLFRRRTSHQVAGFRYGVPALNGGVIVKLLSFGSYDEYKRVQMMVNKKKLHRVWVRPFHQPVDKFDYTNVLDRSSTPRRAQ